MRLGILLLLLLAVLFGSGYWYQIFDSTCRTPIYYRIGEIDARFGTSVEELKRISKNAELVWEDSLSQDLFIYSDEADLPINLVFDERQERANTEEELREDLEAKEGMSEGVAAQYERLVSEFRSLKSEYEKKVITYESKLKKYNAIVTEWNNKGGVPQNQIAALQEEQKQLSAEQASLESGAKELNSLVSQLNLIGSKGNTLITDYNKIVNDYNSHFSEIHEYTQGEHSVEAINVYQFNTEEELTLVLAHEMGHALSLGHVENEESIMYRLMGEQEISHGLSPEDISEYKLVCSEKGFVETLVSLIKNIF